MVRDVRYPLERRASRIAERLKERRETLRYVVAPPGDRPLFHEAKTKSDALAWWRKNRHNDHGAKVLANYTPQQIADLDLALAGMIDAEQDSV